MIMVIDSVRSVKNPRLWDSERLRFGIPLNMLLEVNCCFFSGFFV